VTNDRATRRITHQRLLEISIVFIGHQLENAAREHRRLDNQHTMAYAIGVAASTRFPGEFSRGVGKKAKGAFVSESALHSFDGDKPNSVRLISQPR